MRLVVTEKPSVARDLARVLGVRGRQQGYIEGPGLVITWCVGHLLELQEPAHYDARWRRWSLDTLPMVPPEFELRPRKNAVDQWRVVKRWLRDRQVTEVVNACDAGREGELIFSYAYQAAGARAPVMRFWASSLTDQAIRQAWGRLRPAAERASLQDAARCRSEADWIVGLNATRALTCLVRKGGGEGLLSVGRVQTPTLAMVVRRDREIEAFEPETFFTVDADFEAGAGEADGASVTWRARWFQGESGDNEAGQGDEDVARRHERLPSREQAEAVASAVKGRAGVVEAASSKEKREAPPLLYDLTSLQRRANQRYGLSAQQTLDIAQALYEKHKLISYPRTDARFVTDAEVAEFPEILQAVANIAPYESTARALLGKPVTPGKRVVRPSEVGDHHAILPTNRSAAGRSLSADEKRVYDLVARRFLAVLSPAAVFAVTDIITRVDTEVALPGTVTVPLRFRARGRVCLDQGWQAIDPPKRRKDRLLPNVANGAEATTVDTVVNEGQTRPPRRFDDASILRAMELAGRSLDDRDLARAMRNAGLGTPATRAAILQTLLRRSYLERRGKELWATAQGRALVDAVPVDALTSAELTGRWESRLAEMAEGREARAHFMHDVSAFIGEVVAQMAVAEPPSSELFAAPPASDSAPLGPCPVCGTPVREGRKVFSCETGRGCAFVVFKRMSRRAISPRLVKQLLRDGQTQVVKGFKSKAGKPFAAGLRWDAEAGRVGFAFEPREPAAAAPHVPESTPGPVGMSCPRCGAGSIVRGRTGWGCNQWASGCVTVVPFEEGGRPLTDAEAVERFARLASSG